MAIIGRVTVKPWHLIADLLDDLPFCGKVICFNLPGRVICFTQLHETVPRTTGFVLTARERQEGKRKQGVVAVPIVPTWYFRQVKKGDIA